MYFHPYPVFCYSLILHSAGKISVRRHMQFPYIVLQYMMSKNSVSSLFILLVWEILTVSSWFFFADFSFCPNRVSYASHCIRHRKEVFSFSPRILLWFRNKWFVHCALISNSEGECFTAFFVFESPTPWSVLKLDTRKGKQFFQYRVY